MDIYDGAADRVKQQGATADRRDYLLAELRGFVLARGRKGHEALDREQRSLGLFKTAAAAANVVFNTAASERGTG
jgi:hypothetical protein